MRQEDFGAQLCNAGDCIDQDPLEIMEPSPQIRERRVKLERDKSEASRSNGEDQIDVEPQCQQRGSQTVSRPRLASSRAS